ncbi:hypothetical protein ES703_38501 [subsurface metagenome]
MHLFDPNDLGDCDWESWEEDRLGCLIGICLKCDFIMGTHKSEEAEGR